MLAEPDLPRRAAAETCGTAFLLTAVVGSGIMAERLAGGNAAVALLANAVATGAALVALILTLGPVSGAHLNPVVTVAAAWQGQMRWSAVPAYVVAQVSGALLGVVAAHVMFGLPLVTWSRHVRGGGAELLSEFLATFGLVAVIWGTRERLTEAAIGVGAYITGAYWFTSSTSFANPAVTIARSLTDTFSGITPDAVPGFVIAQFVGAAVGAASAEWLFALSRARAIDDAEQPRPAGRVS